MSKQTAKQHQQQQQNLLKEERKVAKAKSIEKRRKNGSNYSLFIFSTQYYTRIISRKYRYHQTEPTRSCGLKGARRRERFFLYIVESIWKGCKEKSHSNIAAMDNTITTTKENRTQKHRKSIRRMSGKN